MINQKIVGIVLAGGEGSRMNHLDKGLQKFEGKELIKHTLDRLTPQTDSLILSANRNLDIYDKFGHEVISDQSPGFEGPMAGIAACLTHLLNTGKHEYALVCSCDTPFLSLNLTQRLHAALESSEHHVAVAMVAEQRQSLHCLIRRDGWGELIESYQHGVRAMHRWQREVGNIKADFSDQASTFININSLKALKKHSHA